MLGLFNSGSLSAQLLFQTLYLLVVYSDVAEDLLLLLGGGLLLGVQDKATIYGAVPLLGMGRLAQLADFGEHLGPGLGLEQHVA